MPLTEKTNANELKGSVEQTYQKLTQHEHILQRPDTYVGSIELQTVDAWVMNAEVGRMEQKKLKYVPGMFKIFDEILVNAADNKQRDATMSEIRVEIDQVTTTHHLPPTDFSTIPPPPAVSPYPPPFQILTHVCPF